MPTDKDLFSEEQEMTAMSFGEHIEELRTRLILALLGLMVGVVLTFVPPLWLGKLVIKQMQEPATAALTRFYAERARVRSEAAEKVAAVTPTIVAFIPAETFFAELRKYAPKLDLPSPDELKD